MKLLVPIIKFSVKKVELGRSNKSGQGNTDFVGPTRPRRRKRKAAVGVLLLVLIGLLAWVVNRNLSAPAEGSIAQAPSSKQEITDAYANPGTYHGKYIDFSYLAHYKQAPSNLSGSYLEVANFIATDHSSKTISVGILRETLSQDGSYQLRKKQTDIYQQLPQTRFGACFSSQSGGANYTCFSQHNDLVIAVSAAAPAAMDLSPDAQAVLTSLHWKQ